MSLTLGLITVRTAGPTDRAGSAPRANRDSMLKRMKRLAKDALAVPAIRRTYETATRGLLDIGASSRISATIYSFIGFVTFNREQYAVLAGRRSYYRHLQRSERTHVGLRRNTHRLEKGILMQPRRDVFARDYIEETIDFYESAASSAAHENGVDPQELTWAHNVLDNYFSVVQRGDPAIDRSRVRFEALPVPAGVDLHAALHPYPHSAIARSGVTYDELLALARQRRSVRWFEDRPVPRELVDKALVVAREAPTACNRMPYEYLIFDDPELVRMVAGLPFGASGYRHQIPMIIVVKGRLDSYFSPRDRHAIYIDSSLATMGFLLALETLGLSSSVINWPDFEPLEMKMQKALSLEPHERVVCLVAVGYAQPDSLVASSSKKSLDVLRTFNPTRA